MCAVSMIADHYRNVLPAQHAWAVPPATTHWTNAPPPTREEFNALKKEVENLKALMEAAKAYDEATGQPDCEQDEKLALLRSIAKQVGVEL